MTIGLGNATSMVTEAFVDTTVFSIEWLIALAVLVISMLLITRNPKYWTFLAFPLTIGWHIVGLTPSLLQYIFTAIIFGFELFTQGTIGYTLSLMSRKALKKGRMSDEERVIGGFKRGLMKKQLNEGIKTGRRVDFKGINEIIEEMRGHKRKR